MPRSSSYNVTGTATNGGTDYTTLPINVTIPAGATTATLDVSGIIDDSIVEGTETVIVTLTGTDNGLIGIDATPATVNIADNDTATVSIANNGDANETGTAPGQFLLSMTTSSESATVVTYNVTGSATAGGTDYTTLPINVTIPAGATTATLDVAGIVDDTIVEGTETVIVTLTGSDNGLIGIDATPATVNILDNDTAIVSIANNGDASETGSAPGQFLLSMTTSSESATIVSYTVTGTATDGGTDFTTLPVTVTIPAGATTATLDVTGIIDDTIVEGTETVIVTLTGTDNGLIGIDATPATVNIADNDTATVSIANSGDANETGTVAGEFTLTLTTSSASATVVSYSVSGTATAGGTDYTTLPINVTIPAGATTATLDVAGIVDDAIVEGTETVIVTLTGTDNGLIGIDATPATVNILDNDTATVSIANNGDADEAGTVPGQFLLNMTTSSESATVVSYNVTGSATAGGTDYTTLPINVTIPAGATTATLDVTGIIDDNIVEGNETVIVTLTGTDNGLIGIDATPATVNILENDTATVSIAGTTDGNESGPVNGVFTVTQTAVAASDTVLSYSVGGTATEGTDYTALSGTVTVPAGLTSATIDITGIVADSLVEDTETVTITLTGITASDPGITIDGANDNASINIIDGDAATVMIVGTTDGDETGPVNGVFTVTRSADATSATVLSYSVGGTATEGVDYDALSGSLTIPNSTNSVTIDITGIVADSLVEGIETVVITLTAITGGNSGVTIDAANDTDSIDILDGDTATVSIAGTTNGNEAGSIDGVFTVTQTTAAVNPTVISYTVAGSATAPADYAALSGSVTIPGGSTTATIDVTGIVADGLVEGTEDVVITLTGITSSDPGITIDAANDSDSIDILDGDTALVSIAGTTNGNETGPVDGVFTVTQDTASVSNTVLAYAVAGTATEGVDYANLS